MTLWNNLRYASRQLAKNPAFTTTVLATLGLCIGANTAIYTIVDTLYFKALPASIPVRMVSSGRSFGTMPRFWTALSTVVPRE